MQQFMHANLAAKRREGAQRGAPSTSVVTLWGIATPTPRPPPTPPLLLLLLMMLAKMMMALKLQMMMMASFPRLRCLGRPVYPLPHSFFPFLSPSRSPPCPLLLSRRAAYVSAQSKVKNIFRC